nr:conserved hypothetical protein [Serratia symbiotica]
MVGERGFEPPTHWSQTSCATKLRYSPLAGRILLLAVIGVNHFFLAALQVVIKAP